MTPGNGRGVLGSFRLLALPLALALALAVLTALPSVQRHSVIIVSFWGAACALAVWAGALFAAQKPGDRALTLDVALRKQHYLQACAQFSIYVYWGWYWREVYDSAHLIVAQLLFAYAFDMLLSWSRWRTYTLGFGPFPIIFSINLFLWFKPDWFYLQFVMVAVGFLAKEFITWEKDGRRAHIFNPSSFPLGLFSLGLLLTGSTHITWGAEIANTFELPPYIRLWIFLVGLPGQVLFGVTTMTMSAVLSVVGFGLAYHGIFGTYFFVDAFIPAAVFLGMHLLFTDPSTSPRTEFGRIIYGVLYGLGVIALFGLLGKLGAPTFYDKLMAVPLMNLAIQLIDVAARSDALKRFDPARLGRAITGRRRNLAYMSIWSLAFVLMSDPTDSFKPRRWLPFWQQACLDDRRNGCLVLSKLEARYCQQGSAWACNEWGILGATGRAEIDAPPASAFERACAMGLPAACSNAQRSGSVLSSDLYADYAHVPPSPAEYAILLQQGQGPLHGHSPAQLFEEACHQGWADGCKRLAGVHFTGAGVPRDAARAVDALERACELKLPSACADLGVILQKGDGVPVDGDRGRRMLQRACEGGFRPACQRLESPPPAGR